MTSLDLELRHAWRSVRQTRTVTVVAMLCLALGISANVTMLGVTDLLFFRPPAHVSAPDRVRHVYFEFLSAAGTTAARFTSYPNYLDLRRARSLSGLAAFERLDVPFGQADEARRVRAGMVSGSYWRVLGVRPARGRLFGDEETQPGRPGSVVVLSHELWQARFGGSPAVLGSPVRIGRSLYSVVGILPPGFTGTQPEVIDLWLPVNALPDLGMGPRWSVERGSGFLGLVARLQAGVSARSAEAELTGIYRRATSQPGTKPPPVRVVLGPVQAAWGPSGALDIRVAAWLSGISAVVLVIACLNVASLLILRSISRRRDLALRFALGAGQARVLRLVLSEAAILVALAAAASTLLIALGHRLAREYLLAGEVAEVGLLAPRNLLILAGTLVAATMLCGVVPALWSSREDLAPALLAGIGWENGERGIRLRMWLLAAQVALTTVLLAGAGLFVSSLLAAHGLHLGMDLDHLLLVTIDLEGASVPKSQADSLYRAAIERTRRIPGVAGAGLMATVPLLSGQVLNLATPGSFAAPNLPLGGPYVNAVTADFFATAGTHLRWGRLFKEPDREGRVAVVNETMAQVFWPARSALGRCLRVGGESAPCATVVGVVEDSQTLGLRLPQAPEYYLPLAQAPEELPATALVVKASGDPSRLTGPVRRGLKGLVPGFALLEVQPFTALLAPQIRPWRLGAVMFTMFGLLALGVASIGLYSVVAYSAERRAPELAIRIALGGTWLAVSWCLLRRSLAATAAGGLTGLGIVALGADDVQSLLFKTSALDPQVLLLAWAVPILCALGASLSPSWKVRGMDVVKFLKQL